MAGLSNGVHVSEKFKIVAVPADPAVRNLFLDAKEVTLGGKQHLLIDHKPTETYMLRKLGYEVPAPILMHYDWAGGTPFEVQKKTCAMLTSNPRAFVLNGLGTGKTKAALWGWDYLNKAGLAKKLLVCAPLSTINFTWIKEAFDTVPQRQIVSLHHSSKATRLKRLASDADIFVINHDGLKVIYDDVMKMVASGEIDALVLDELAVYRNGGSARTKMTRKLAHACKIVWGMTGSPIPTSPTDAWAQATIVQPGNVPKYFNRFRDDLMHKVSTFKYVPKPDAVEKAFKALQPSVRYTLDDIMELPEAIERFTDVDMGKEQARIYKSMADKCFAAVQNHEITAANAGAVMMKLLQVATGWVYTSEGKTVPLDNDKRITALIDAIAGTDRKVLVFVPFKHALKGISEAMTKEGIEHAVVSGDTPSMKRSAIFAAFQNTDKYKVIAAHPQCLAHGVTLTAADTIIWFAPVTSLEIYEQANGRIRRVGQKHKQLYIHLQSTPVEKRIYKLLQNKQGVQNKLLELFEEASE
jgi:SNF2 family DNA or RNA helicase